MKKLIELMLALVFVISLCACGSGAQDPKDLSREQLEEMLEGKWLLSETDGEPVLTNAKSVYTFEDGKAYVSESLSAQKDADAVWGERLEAELKISGNKVTISYSVDEHAESVHEYVFLSITDNKFTAKHTGTVMEDGNEPQPFEHECSYVKINEDYSKDIIGTWEGRCTSEGSVFDDGKVHRWEYKEGGAYVFYLKEGDNWVPTDDAISEYFVDGDLLCTRWSEGEIENREWWEIAINGDKMSWTSTREGEDGKRFTATFEMKKVKDK